MNEGSMVRQLDSLEEHREAAIIRLADYQQKLPQQYNKDVKERESSVWWPYADWDINARKLVPN